MIKVALYSKDWEIRPGGQSREYEVVEIYRSPRCQVGGKVLGVAATDFRVNDPVSERPHAIIDILSWKCKYLY